MNKFSIKTTTLAEDIVVATLDEIGIQGAEIEDKQPLTEDEKAQMFVDIMPEGPADEGIAYVNYYLEEDEDADAILENVKDIAICKLTSADVVRHALVQRIINAYEKAEAKRQDNKNAPIKRYQRKF